MRILRVRIDRTLACQLESCLGGIGDDRRPLHIAALAFLDLARRFGQMVFDKAKRAAGLEHREHLVERGLGLIGGPEPPVVHVAEGQHDVRRACGNGRLAGDCREHGIAQRAIGFGHRLALGPDSCETLLARRSGIKRAAGREIGRKDLGIPAAAGPDLDDRVTRLHTEKRQRLGGVAESVARDRRGRSRPGFGRRDESGARRGIGCGIRRCGGRQAGSDNQGKARHRTSSQKPAT